MIVFESPFETWPGSFSLPAYEDFTGQMFNEYRDGMNARNDKDQSKYAHDLRRKAAFVGIEWIKKYGSWDIDGVSVNDIAAWESDPAQERPKLVAWIGQNIGKYYNDVLDPNG